MKKTIFLIIAFLFLFSGCAKPVENTAKPSETQSTETAPVATKGAVGLSLSEENAFNSDFAAEFKRLVEAEGYTVITKYAKNDKSVQTEDILQLLMSDVKVMLVDAVNIDELEQAMDECDSNKVPVISLLKPINHETKMLISPDFKEMGKQAGEAAKTLLTSGDQIKGNVLMLQGGYDSFLMQMYHDGFKAELPASEQVTQDSPYCDFDTAKAYSAVKEAITAGKKIDLIFTQSESMAKGALQALDELKTAAKIVTVGADADIINAITQKKIASAIYYSPIELAQKAQLYTLKILNNQTPIPPWTGVNIAKADEKNASGLIAEGRKYASVPAQGQ